MGILDIVRRDRHPSYLPTAPVRSPEGEFWAWFVANERRVWNLRRDPDAVTDALITRMHRVNTALAFDIGPTYGSRREFVVTAAGDRSAFPAVIRLASAAPPLRRWTVTAFRPRREIAGELVMICGDRLRLEEVRFAASRIGDKLYVKLFIPGYRWVPMDEFSHVGGFLLSLAVGEFDAATRLGGVTAGAPRPGIESRPLAELPALVDALAGE